MADTSGLDVYNNVVGSDVLAARLDVRLDALETALALLGQGTLFPITGNEEPEGYPHLCGMNKHVEASGNCTLPVGATPFMHCVEISALTDLTVGCSAGQVFRTNVESEEISMDVGTTWMFYWNGASWRIRG